MTRRARVHNVCFMANVYRHLEGFAEEGAGEVEYMESRSPVHARFLATAADLVLRDDDVRDAVLEAWRDRDFHARYERPLLLCAAVRFDALRDPSHPLRAALGTEPPDPSALDRDAVRASLLRPVALDAIRTRFVQTNEITRAVTWRWPLSLLARGRRAVLADLGCSAGLNLVADGIDLAWTDEATRAPIAIAPVPIDARLGLDRAPIDLRDDDPRDWLRASIWPGQTERLARFDAAAARVIDGRARGEIAIEACDAAAMPARLDAFTRAAPAGALVLAYQTVMRDYLLPDVAARYDAGMRDWILAHPDRAAWCELERAPKCAPGPAEIRVHVARHRSVRTVALASGEFHPASLVTNATAVAELAAA